MSDEHLRVATDDGICTITIDRPDARNALSLAMRRSLKEQFAAAGTDDGVAVIVLTGADPAFCAGVDVKELRSGEAREGGGEIIDPAAALHAVPKPVLGAINGVCVTGGLELALACDVLIASEHARFADTHVKLGLVPAWGMSAFLAHAVGTRKAVELSLTGEFIDAGEALRIGLVNHVLTHDDLMPRTYEIAAAMRDADAIATGTVLDIYRRAAGRSVEDALELEHEAFERWLASRSGR
ncbi:MAG: enoyl-CoA hydratase [Acidimicrobiia bacterium]